MTFVTDFGDKPRTTSPLKPGGACACIAINQPISFSMVGKLHKKGPWEALVYLMSGGPEESV
ncbi:MAG: hypothetical protein NTW53_18415 [Burkholderiales bacterium]|nr:hypothetical protein [Burkholderiales bacterium]